MLKSAALVGAAALTGMSSPLFAHDEHDEHDDDEHDFYDGGAPWADLRGWKLGCQAYSFNHYTFKEAVEKNASMGLRYIEAFPGQKISKELDAGMGPGLTKEQRFEVKAILAEHHTVMLNFGVTEASKENFDFAADMGIETIVCEPEFDKLPALSKMADEYKINLALHNHPNPSRYWDYKIVLEHIKDLSPRIGACADTGHYLRSGINPLEAIKALKGHIISFHLKDLNQKGKDGHDVPWGTGVADLPAILDEVKAQRFRGVFSIEYEYNWETSVPEIAQCVEFFNEQAKRLARG